MASNTWFQRMDQRDFLEPVIKFKKSLSRAKNNKQELKKIFRPKGNIPLFINAIKRSADFAAYLIEFATEYDVDSCLLLESVLGRNPLHVAVEKGNQNGAPSDVLRAIVTLARDNGVNVALLFRADGKGRTPLHLASSKHSEVVNTVIELAKECGISAKSLTSPDRTGNSPLHYAAMVGDDDSVEAILNFGKDSGVDVTGLFHPNVDGKTPLHFASITENAAFDTLLSWAISNKVPLDSMLEADSDGRTPLHSLADFHLCDDDEREDTKQILEIANQCGQMHVVLGPDRSGQTPLHLASYGSSRVVEAIIQSAVSHGKDMVQTIFAPDDEGQTPLHIAVESEKFNVALVIMQTASELGKEMVEAILAPDKRGINPLQMQITRDCVYLFLEEAIMQFTVKNGFDWRKLIDTKDADIRSRLDILFHHQILNEPWIWSTLYPSRSFVALRKSDRSRNTQRLMVYSTSGLWYFYSTRSLSDDVLFQIFEYLDVADLSNCEMVCRRWRNVLSRNIIWSKLLDRERSNGGLWQRVKKIMELKDEQFLQCGSREKCKMISRKLQDLDNNWKTGNYQMKIVTSYWGIKGDIKYDEDYLIGLSNYSDNHFIIVNKRTMEKEREFHHGFRGVSDFQIHRNIIVIASAEVLRVFDATTAEQVNEIVVPNNWRVVNLSFGHGLLAALSESRRNLPKRRQLTVWRVNSATDIEHLVDLSIAGDEGHEWIKTTHVAMDERYIAVWIDMPGETKMYLVSTESWNIIEDSTKTDADGHILQYHRGVLITRKDNCIRLKNVWTKECRKINLKPYGLSSERTQIGANSKYLVVMNGQSKSTKVGIFRLNADGKMAGCNNPLCCFDIPMKVRWFQIDETGLICVCDRRLIMYLCEHVVVIDFLSTLSVKETNDDEISCRFNLAKEIHETLYNL